MHAVFFDIGKVLIDFDYNSVADKLSHISERPVRSGLTGSAPLFDAYHRGTVTDDQLHQYFIDEFGTTRDFKVFEDALCSSFSRIEAGLTLLRNLLETPGVRVGIISDNHEICTRWLARETPELFKSHTIILSQQVGGLKPEPIMYESALESIGLPADACMFIDDREPNIIGALGYGMKGIVHRHWAITTPLVEEFIANAPGL